MSRVLMNEHLGEKLRSASETVELIDEAGRILGVYTPIRVHVPPAGYRFPISDEELDRRNQIRTGRTLSEIMSGLAKNS